MGVGVVYLVVFFQVPETMPLTGVVWGAKLLQELGYKKKLRESWVLTKFLSHFLFVPSEIHGRWWLKPYFWTYFFDFHHETWGNDTI